MKNSILLIFLVFFCLKINAQIEYRYNGDHYYEHLELYRNNEFYLEIYQSMSKEGLWGNWVQENDTVKLYFYPRITPKIWTKYKKKKNNYTLFIEKKDLSLLSMNNLNMYIHLEDNSIMGINEENSPQIDIDKRVKGIFFKASSGGDTYIYEYIEKKANTYKVELYNKREIQRNYLYKNDCIIPFDKEGQKKYKLKKADSAF